MRRYSRFKIMWAIIILSISTSVHSQSVQNSTEMKSVAIIKAAGFVEGQKSQGVDAITEATSVGRNVHVISDALQKELKQLGIKSEIIQFNDTCRIQNILKDSAIRMIIFAGPAYSSEFPQQLQKVVPNLRDIILERKIICTSMTTCRFLGSGERTVKSFNNELKDLGISTIDGLVIHHEYEDDDWESKIEAFAERLQQTCQRPE